MSRTSTDEGRFRRALALTVGVLVLACAVFLALGYLQGPKLSSAQVDTTGVTDQSEQQLRLFANQRVAQVDESQVSISPAVPFSVTTTNDLIAVQFGQRLAYGTEYEVRVEGVTSQYLAQPATLSYTFTTDSPTVYYLDRGTPDDSIVATGLSGPDRTVVYSAPRIQDFAVLDGMLAVVTLESDRTSSVDLVSLIDGVVEPLRLPDTGSIGTMDVAASGTTLGFTLTSADAGIGQLNSSTLYTVDLGAGRDVVAVMDLAGEPLNVTGWQFVPDSTSLIALSLDRDLMLVDPESGTVLPLGQYQEFGSVSVDGRVVTVSDPFSQIALTIADGTEERLSASPVDGFDAFLGATQVLPNGDRVEKAVVPDDTGTRFSSLLLYDDGTASRLLYRTVNDGGSIASFSVSPNGQYVAIETVPDISASTSDGYFLNSRSTSVTTVVVDIATGAQVRSFEGFALHW